MRTNTRRDIERILHNFKQGKFDRIKVAYLVIKLRDYIDDPIVKDIAHFIAHESRDRGKSHKLATRYLEVNKKFLAPESDGPRVLYGLPPIIKQTEFLEVITKTLTKFNMLLDLKSNDFQFYRALLENLEGAKLFLIEPDSYGYERFELSELNEDKEGRINIYIYIYNRRTESYICW